MAPKCPECDANADLTKDGSYAHCASCNTIFEPGKEGSSERGTAHPDYVAKDEGKQQDGQAGEQEVEGSKNRG
jgi:hypothetical protein